MSTVTRIIKITECRQCPHFMCGIGCAIADREDECPPTGAPDWCPLETLEEKGGEG